MYSHGVSIRVALVVLLLATGCVRGVEARATNWWSARTAHVRVRTDGGRDRAIDTARRMEGIHAALTQVFFACPATGTAEAVDVVVLSSPDEFHELRASWSAGAFHHGVEDVLTLPPRILLDGENAARATGTQLFTHELAHRFVAACFPAAPVWLHEGLASLYETLNVHDGQIAFGIPAYQVADIVERSSVELRDVVARQVFRRLVPLPSELLAMDRGGFYEPEGGVLGTRDERIVGHYAAAWALVHMLELGDDTDLTRRFHGYLASLMEAERSEDDAWGLEFAWQDLDTPFAAYLSRPTYPWLRVPHESTRLADLAVEPVSLAAAHTLLAELHLTFAEDGGARAEAHLEAAEREVPGDPAPALLRATFASGAARADAIAQAATSAPDHLDVLRARAIVALETGTDAVALGAALQARDDLRPTDRVVVAEILRSSGRPSSALRYALDAARGDPSSWRAQYELALVLVDLERTASARLALRRVIGLTSHHLPSAAAEAERMLAELADSATAPTP